MNYPKTKCKYCGQLIRNCNLNRHYQRHENNPNSFNRANGKYKILHDGLICQYCGKECKNKNSLCNHERMCRLNPNKQICVHETTDNFAEYRKVYGSWNRGLTAKTDERVALNAQKTKEYYEKHPPIGRQVSQETKDKISKTMSQKSILNYKYKYGFYNGIPCDSSWELAFLIYNIDHNINIQRCDEVFEYTYQGETHKYSPDFKIGDTIYEIKNFDTDKSIIKAQTVKELGKTIKVLHKKDMKVYIDYCIEKYGENYFELYDEDKPSWKNKL